MILILSSRAEGKAWARAEGLTPSEYVVADRAQALRGRTPDRIVRLRPWWWDIPLAERVSMFEQIQWMQMQQPWLEVEEIKW